MTEENISKLKELSSWIIQSEKQRDSRKEKRTEPQRPQRSWDNSKSNIHMIRVPEGKKKSKPENKLCDIGIRIDI